MNRRESEAGLMLPELLVALSAGLLLAAMALQALVAETRLSQRLGARLRQRQLAGRALTLVQLEAARAQRLVPAGLGGGQPACGLSGRRVLLHLEGGAGPITYTVGPAPSGIWRGAVLMRCGPAYGLDGEPSGGAALNRVVLDGLESAGTTAERLSPGVVQLTLNGAGRQRRLLAERG